VWLSSPSVVVNKRDNFFLDENWEHLGQGWKYLGQGWEHLFCRSIAISEEPEIDADLNEKGDAL